jgi:orotate phosphoribosyltransferase
MNSRTEQEWIKEYMKSGALWIHDGNPKRPHVVLSSKKHSNGFFNSELVMDDPVLLNDAAYDLVSKMGHDFAVNIQAVKCVAGPAMGAITWAHDVARHISLITGNGCRRAYAEKDEELGMVFKRTAPREGDVVLPVEDVLTTGGSVSLMLKAIRACKAETKPFVGLIVNRSGQSMVEGHALVALITRPMPTWELNECPLCAVGSKVVSAKGKDNWALLNANYD